MPLERGRDPTNSAASMSAKAVSGSAVTVTPCSSGKAQSSSSHALHRRQRRFDVEQIEHDRLIGTQQVAARDAEEQGIADLTGCTADGDMDGGFGHGMILPVWRRSGETGL
jgi:hypothetical protein